MSHSPRPSNPLPPDPDHIPTLNLKCFTNTHLCRSGALTQADLYFSPATGRITPNPHPSRTDDGVERIDLAGAVLAPGFLDLQTNGMNGFHFTQLGGEGRSKAEDEAELGRVARTEVRVGVTGWWGTVPTVEGGRWREILPLLHPRPFPLGASLLGAHAEGPYLHPVKKGAHNASYFLTPRTGPPPETLYNLGTNSPSTLKLLTLAPELPGSLALVSHLQAQHPSLILSLGHSTATYATGLAALSLGAKALTHTFNAMAPLHHRDPGLAGLMGVAPQRPYYSVIADGVHLHGSVLRIALRADPARCVLITDSVELAGLADGLYEGNGQVEGRQRKMGDRVTLVRERDRERDGGEARPPPRQEGGEGEGEGEGEEEGVEVEEEETLIGSCCTLDQCVRNMVAMADCTLAEAVRCVTENVAGLMGENERGVLEPGRRADFVVLDKGGQVKETWVGGVRVYKRREEEEGLGESVSV